MKTWGEYRAEAYISSRQLTSKIMYQVRRTFMLTSLWFWIFMNFLNSTYLMKYHNSFCRTWRMSNIQVWKKFFQLAWCTSILHVFVLYIDRFVIASKMFKFIWEFRILDVFPNVELALQMCFVPWLLRHTEHSLLGSEVEW
jgi:hypothetical protein